MMSLYSDAFIALREHRTPIYGHRREEVTARDPNLYQAGLSKWVLKNYGF